VKASELKKGDMLTLKNGWKAELRTNKKGNIRDAIVYGYATDYGTIYVWDIASPVIELTPAQEKAKKIVQAVGF